MLRSFMTAIFVCSLTLVGCGGDDAAGDGTQSNPNNDRPPATGGPGETGDTSGDDSTDTTGDNSGDSTSTAGRTVANCDTNIADDVPAFYKKYFRCVTITMDGDSVVIESDGLPPHLSFYYETSDENYTDFVSQGDGFYQNPNRIEAQNIRLSLIHI